MRQGESLSRSERRQQFVNTRPFEEDICSSSSSCNNSCYNSSSSCCCYCCCCQLHLATFSANAMTQFVATTFHMSLVAVAQPPPSPQQIPIDLEADRTLSHSHSSHPSPSPAPSSPSPSLPSLHLPHTDLHALCAASFPVGIFCFASQPQPQPASLSRRLLRLRRGIAIMCHQLCQLLHMPQHKRNNTKHHETLRNSLHCPWVVLATCHISLPSICISR